MCDAGDSWPHEEQVPKRRAVMHGYEMTPDELVETVDGKIMPAYRANAEYSTTHRGKNTMYKENNE